MARQRQSPEVKKGMFGRTLNAAELAAAERNNSYVAQADAMLGAMPERVQNLPYARDVADRIVDIRNLPSNPRAQIAAGGLAAAALVGGGIKAYADQRSDYLPAGPFDVAGRMINNLIPAQQSVGADPLAAARINVAQAADLVGTEAVLDAIAADQINEMRGVNSVAMSPVEYEEMTTVQKMIDDRAMALMQQPIQKADGSVGPLPYDTAQRLATEQINMELRAGNAY